VSRIDHLWLRVGDLPGARLRFLAHAREAGYRLKHDEPRLVRFAAPTGLFTLLLGEPPTQHVTIAFPGGTTVEIE